MIHGVDDKGTWIDDPDQVKLIILDHFKNQFSSQPQNRPSLEHMFSNRLSRNDREMLEAEFTNEEIKEAVFSCASDKAPGPDGFNFHFIKSVWSTIEGDITNFIKEFHKYGRLVRGINASYITLVPKKKNPTTLKEYRLVSMVGSLYKILAKVLANRLRKVIGKVISMTQSAFLEGRQLIDSVLALNELVHDLKRRKEMGILFKVDFEKAFDSVDWDYLDSMQSSLGFGDKWRGWIKECLTSAFVSILVNGSPTQEFKMQKGLRQGDPLSPYLFLIAAKGLHALVHEAVKKNLLTGIAVDRDLSVSHLQFAYDTILLGEASLKSIRAFKFILRWFKIISGLKINFSKSTLYGINIEENWLNMAASTLNSKCGQLPFLYLGLPVGGNPHCLRFWKPVVEKFRSMLATWKGKLLSFGGCITFLTSGGLGIPNLSIRNSALLGKWWNNFYDAEGNEKLWKKIIVRKYYDGVSSTSISNIASPSLSPFWKDILSIGRDCDRAFGCFDDGFIRKLGDGSNTRFWKDAWMGSSPLMFSYPRLSCLTLSKDALVAELKLGNAGGWAFQWRKPPFDRELDELERLEDSLRNLNLSD
ncbi:hypothetical protein SLEP1_g53669 [Rubroshorea leprosula]|uniref:Reverse transcriptase domain-containing protein n=1 Tax=Rubroshorea leprosula TaxID=152421 RepID=A0AAV5MDZ3_9ROSI|nr:hypothetical protein SLEP1_g53669 [Rubroshorea leprosula]